MRYFFSCLAFLFFSACVANGLSHDEAELLVMEKWGVCSNDICDSFEVKVIEELKIEVTYYGLRDDSLRDIRRVADVYKENGEWIIGNVLRTEFRCQKGRGQQDWEEKLCN